MSTPTEAKPLTVDEIDEVLRHWSAKLHNDPDPLNRWHTLEVVDSWLDTRLRLEALAREQRDD